jgi:hypothetical protein
MVVVDYQIALQLVGRSPPTASAQLRTYTGVRVIPCGLLVSWISALAASTCQPPRRQIGRCNSPATVSGWTHGRAVEPGCCLGSSTEFP